MIIIHYKIALKFPLFFFIIVSLSAFGKIIRTHVLTLIGSK